MTIPPPPAPPPPGPPQPPFGYYPQQSYYAPGWPAAEPAPAPPRRRRWLGITAAVVAGVLALAAIGLPLFRQVQSRPLAGVTQARTVNALQVAAGHCLAELPPDGVVARVSLTPCDQPHEAEALGVLRLDEDSWPGQEAVTEQVDAWCEMDNQQLALGFQEVIWTPSAQSWAQGDRSGLCLAWYDGGQVTGSFRDGDVRTD